MEIHVHFLLMCYRESIGNNLFVITNKGKIAYVRPSKPRCGGSYTSYLCATKDQSEIVSLLSLTRVTLRMFNPPSPALVGPT